MQDVTKLRFNKMGKEIWDDDNMTRVVNDPSTLTSKILSNSKLDEKKKKIMDLI